MIALTFDIDWAPEEVIQDTVNILLQYEVKATFFATHHSKILETLENDKFEVGIHPNFNGLLLGNGGSYIEIIDNLLNIYPSAVGFRSHCLAQSTPILNYCSEVGIKYDCNLLLPYQTNINPFYYFNGILRIPYFWEDDTHYLYNKPYSLDSITINKNGLNIFDFHPVHIYLNTDSEGCYNKAKPYYQNPQELIKHRNNLNRGSRDFLIELLEHIKKTNTNTLLLKEILENFERTI